MALESGCELITDLYGVSKELLWNKKLARDFLNSLPPEIGMKVIRKAEVIEYHANDTTWLHKLLRKLGLRKEIHPDSGLTGTVILAESSVCYHGFPERGFLYLNIFSCKSFDSEAAMQYIKDIWKPEEDSPYAVLKRGTDFNGNSKGQEMGKPGSENDQV